MAEVLGVVSGGFAVASLAIQLIEVAQQMHTFWHSVKDSTSDIEHVKSHLTILSSISSSIIEICNKHPQIVCGQEVFKSLSVCKSRIDKLADLAKSISHEAGPNRSKKSWLTFKATLKRRTIREIEADLRGDVMLLLLSLQPFFLQVQRYDARLITADIKHQWDGYSTVDANQPNSNLLRASRGGTTSPGQKVNLYSRPLNRKRGSALSEFTSQYLSFKLDSYSTLERVLLPLGMAPFKFLKEILKYFLIDLGYISLTRHIYLNSDDGFLSDHRRRLKIISSFAGYYVQTSSLCRQLNVYPIIECQSQIFKLCIDGDIDAVKLCFTNSWVSPLVTNQHGENLLHASARYAHAELCCLLLSLGVDGSAFDDRLWTPLDHLCNKIDMAFAYPSRVVDTIRALVERGGCQPLLHLTSNTSTFYRGPEEGFAWLFNSEYADIDMEERDSEDWTLLGDAAFTFGWWSRLGLEDPTLDRQSLYLLRAGADLHAVSGEGHLTPLDAYLRGCTLHHVDHATKWLQMLSSAGIDLHQYADAERAIHEPEHLLKACWDEELRRWIPTRRRVTYRYGESSDQLEIWLEDYDALSWFGVGRHDLEIFEVMSASQSEKRWRDINAKEGRFDLEYNEQAIVRPLATKAALLGIGRGHWLWYIIASLCLNYAFHNYLHYHSL